MRRSGRTPSAAEIELRLIGPPEEVARVYDWLRLIETAEGLRGCSVAQVSHDFPTREGDGRVRRYITLTVATDP